MRLIPFSGTLVLALIVAACAAFRPDPLPSPQVQDLQAHVRTLASDEFEGRMTGTAGYEKAVAYVEGEFQRLGLIPAGNAGYRQDVPYAASLIRPEKSSVVLHRGGRRERFRWKTDYVAGCDPLDPRPAVRAPMVFVGYGVQAPDLGHDDYAGVDARGKIVVLFSGAPREMPANPRAYYSRSDYKRRLAAERGAVGMISLRRGYDVRTYPWDRTARNAGQQPSMYWTAANGSASDHYPQLKGQIAISESAAQRLFAGQRHSHAELLALEDAGQPLPPFALKGEIEIRRQCAISQTRASNVIGLLTGTDPALRDEYVVYTAHLDHIGRGAAVDGDAIYNGAYDNAMGIAALIETARLLAAAPLRRSVLFVAVGGEERGLLGSDYFAEHPTVPLGSIVANINLDMPLFLYPLADVVAFGAEHSSLGPLVAQAAVAEGWQLSPDPLPEEVIFIRSDQYSLVQRGVPAVFLVSGFTSADPSIDGAKAFMAFMKNHYHQPSDDLDLPVHWGSAARFVRVNARIGRLVGNAAERPRWNEGNFFGELFSRTADAASR